MKLWLFAVFAFLIAVITFAPTSTDRSEIAASCHTALHDPAGEKQCVDMQIAADTYLKAIKRMNLPGYDTYMLDCLDKAPVGNDETFLALCIGVHVHEFLYRKVFPPTVQEPDSDDEHFNPPDPFADHAPSEGS